MEDTRVCANENQIALLFIARLYDEGRIEADRPMKFRELLQKKVERASAYFEY